MNETKLEKIYYEDGKEVRREVLKEHDLFGWKLSTEAEKVFDRVSDFILYGIIYFVVIALFVALQFNEYQARSYCKVFIDTAQCACGYDTSILTNRSIALPNPALLPGDTAPFNPLYSPDSNPIK